GPDLAPEDPRAGVDGPLRPVARENAPLVRVDARGAPGLVRTQLAPRGGLTRPVLQRRPVGALIGRAQRDGLEVGDARGVPRPGDLVHMELRETIAELAV